MIRVFYKDKWCVGDYMYIEHKDGIDKLHLIQKEFGHLIALDEIVKIEKQVKDLTLEECRKLGLTETFAFEWGFGLDRGGISNDFRDDDYIDITNLVKGQVE